MMSPAFTGEPSETLISTTLPPIEGKTSIENIDVAMVDSKLYTVGIPDPDFIIRTSGEKRLSNFLTWQSTYAELYFPEIFWPEFDENQMDKAIEEYIKRNRRFGGN